MTQEPAFYGYPGWQFLPALLPETLTETKFQPLKQACDYHYTLSINH